MWPTDEYWRRDRDSNPGDSYPSTRFPGGAVRPAPASLHKLLSANKTRLTSVLLTFSDMQPASYAMSARPVCCRAGNAPATCFAVKTLRCSHFVARPKRSRVQSQQPETTAAAPPLSDGLSHGLRPAFPPYPPRQTGYSDMAAYSGFPREGGFPDAMHYSIITLPPTLRAVRGCCLYVRDSINTLHLANFRCLSSSFPGQD